MITKKSTNIKYQEYNQSQAWDPRPRGFTSTNVLIIVLMDSKNTTVLMRTAQGI